MIFDHPISVGFDFSDSQIRFVECEQKKRKIVLRHALQQPIAEGVIEQGIVRKPEQLTQAIGALFKGERQFRQREIVASLPERQCFLKTMIVHPNQHSFRDLVAKEARNHVPVPLEDLSWDEQIMEKITHGLTYSYLILFAGIPKKILEPYEQCLLSARLIPAACEVDAVACVRALLPWDQPPSPTLIIDIGSSATTLTIVDQHAIQFSVTFDIFSGNACTRAIAKDGLISEIDAERLKQQKGLNDNHVRASLEETLKLLNEELVKISVYYHHHCEPDCKLEQLLLTGSGSGLPGLTEWLQSQRPEHVALANPLLHVESPSHAKTLLTNPHSFTTAIGCALRPFQPRPHDHHA